MRLTDKEANNLQKEIDHILDSGTNSIRILEMINIFLERRELVNKTDDIHSVSQRSEQLKTIDELHELSKNIGNVSVSLPAKNRLTDLAIQECEGCWLSEGVHMGTTKEEIKELDGLIKEYKKQ